MDVADDAGVLEEQARDIALHRQRTANNFDLPSELDCLDCGVEIPEQRRAYGGVTLCVTCKTIEEALSR